MRAQRLNWSAIEPALHAHGFAYLGRLLDYAECAALRAAWSDERQFRSHVVMARHAFGQGEYKYFAYPLPEVLADLRHGLYSHLAPIANQWCEWLAEPVRYPESLGTWLRGCHEAGQRRPTPLLLRYVRGDYNRLHQDLYGEQVFPMQVIIMLSRPRTRGGDGDFGGGELVLTEQRARMQSRVQVVDLRQGEAVVIATSVRPMKSARGWSRATMRHGVSEVLSGERMTAGLIFHDAA